MAVIAGAYSDHKYCTIPKILRCRIALWLLSCHMMTWGVTVAMMIAVQDCKGTADYSCYLMAKIVQTAHVKDWPVVIGECSYLFSLWQASNGSNIYGVVQLSHCQIDLYMEFIHFSTTNMGAFRLLSSLLQILGCSSIIAMKSSHECEPYLFCSGYLESHLTHLGRFSRQRFWL